VPPADGRGTTQSRAFPRSSLCAARASRWRVLARVSVETYSRRKGQTRGGAAELEERSGEGSERSSLERQNVRPHRLAGARRADVRMEVRKVWGVCVYGELRAAAAEGFAKVAWRSA
jgi:hypothetical protein